MPKFLDFRPRGAARELFSCRQDEVVVSGPAGTGKSRGCLERCYAIAYHWPGSRGLIARKTRASLTNTTLVTFGQLVLLPEDAVRMTYKGVTFPNGSRIDFGGLDKSSRIMSSEYDWIYIPEATEVTEADWESLTTRLRWGHVPYQQLFADCNPGPPTHWLKRRANAKKTLMLESRHEDNPRLWTTFDQWRSTLSPIEKRRHAAVEPWQGESWTPDGLKYIAKLDALSGARYLRLRKGIWAAAEGMVYETYAAAVHMIPRWLDEDETVPVIKPHWTRIWSIDFGFSNPFVWQAWAVDPDGRMYRYREIYTTGKLVEDLARQIKALCKAENEPKPAAIVCDHDAEDRATFERHMGMPTVPAYKAVSPGIQAVQKRLRLAGDGKPRLYFLRDSLVEVDPMLLDARKPTCTEEEIEAYVWPKLDSQKESSQKRADTPVKIDDHGMDDMRYAVAAVDRVWLDPSAGEAELQVGHVGDYRISSI